jgi:hypothetical protein
MPLTGIARNRFIEGLTSDLLKNIPDPSAEVRDGMREYATSLYERITALVKESTIFNASDNSDTSLKLK